ncbi:polysaccharide lyase family 8 super-sandwich domain-containing protein [Paenibacillus yanchengensis]|uniref:Polysaccharide lyase family 8 super-sandwich domain-containing protein n=1 Tax=Paenibacillus yanchengensis TaxID=2035833 RepID=A0ABW4YI90_9BACL
MSKGIRKWHRYISLFLVATLLTSSLAITPPQVSADEQQTTAFSTMRSKWFDYITGGSSLDLTDRDIQQAVTVQAEKVSNTDKNGVWDTLNREESRTFLWEDLRSISDSSHITKTYHRLKDMAIAYATPGSEWYADEALQSDILSGLDWMDEHRYNKQTKVYNNWWDWEIGAPLAVLDILTLMYDDLSVTQLANHMATIDHFIPHPAQRFNSTVKETGANLLDKSLAVLVGAILEQNEAKVVEARDAIAPAFLYVTKGDGFYKDGSFIQHNNIAYTGSYGSVLLGNISRIVLLLEQSPWPIEDTNFVHVWEWIEQSFEPVIVDGHIMEMISGRAVSRFNNNTRGAVASILRLAQSAPAETATSIKSMVKEWVSKDTSLTNPYSGLAVRDIVQLKQVMHDDTIKPRGELQGHYHFAMMDKVVHPGAGYTFALSMSSAMVANYESINGEFTKGWYTGDGMTYLYNADSNHYRNGYWPTVDPYRMPGTTADGLPRTAGITTGKTWVGGTVLEDKYGSAGMDLAPVGSTLTGKKSWFMFDNEVVALGAGLTTKQARNDGRQVETIVENRMINDAGTNKLTINDQEQPQQLDWSEEIKSARWAHLEGTNDGADIGYYFPEPVTLSASRTVREGSWKSINTSGPTDPIKRNYVHLSLGHGVQPTQEKYVYTLLPSASKQQTKAYTKNPDIVVLSNTEQIQAVEERQLGIIGINFWESGTFEQIQVNKPAAIMYKLDGDELTLSIADPTKQQVKLQVNVGVVTKDTVQANDTIQTKRLDKYTVVEVDTSAKQGETHTITLKIDSSQLGQLPFVAEPDEGAKVKIVVSEDTYVRGGSEKDNNFNSSGFMNVFGGTNDSDRKVFLKFAGMILDKEIERAYVNVYGQTNDKTGTSSDIGVYVVSNHSWQEKALTYNSMPKIGEQIAVQTITNPAQWWKYDITDYMKGFTIEQPVNISLALQQVSKPLYAEIYSREKDQGATAAYLEIYYKDEQAPKTALSTKDGNPLQAKYTNEVVFELQATDETQGWGVYKTEYRLNGGAWKVVYNHEIRVQGAGDYQLEYRSTDKAGNVESIQTASFQIMEAKAQLTTPQAVNSLETLSVQYEIVAAEQQAYANQLTLQYDDTLFEFVDVVTASEQIKVAAEKRQTGQVALVIVGDGAPLPMNKTALTFQFKVKAVDQVTTGEITITDAILGLADGQEIVLSGATHELQVNNKPSVPVYPEYPGQSKLIKQQLTSLMPYFGVDEKHDAWQEAMKYDWNKDGKIDLLDMAALALSKSTQSNNMEHSSDEPSFHLTTNKREIKLGELVTFTVQGEPLSDIYAQQLQLHYDPNVVELQQIEAPYPGFSAIVNDEAGIVTWVFSQIGEVEKRNVESLAQVTFKAKGEGKTIVAVEKIVTVTDTLAQRSFTPTQLTQSLNIADEQENSKPDIAIHDITGHWAESVIREAVEAGWITGYPDQSFRPDATVSRAEFATLLARALQWIDEDKSNNILKFVDKETIPAWALPYITSSVNLGIITGYPDQTFRPEQSIIRAEMIVMSTKAASITNKLEPALSFADAAQIPTWSMNWIAAAQQAELIEGRSGNKLEPLATSTRAEAVKLITSILAYLQ